MREIHPGLAADLAAGTTTLCRCWRIRRRDGVELGFTDHDLALEFEGLRFEPESGFGGTEIERGLGLSVDNAEAMGALRSDRITERDVAAGRYDGAQVTQWMVDWRAVDRRAVLFVGETGEIRRGGAAFEVELLGLSNRLGAARGRAYQRRCDAELGDARCGVDVSAFEDAGTVGALRDARRFVAAGLPERSAGWYATGRLRWTSGANAGAETTVGAHVLESGRPVLDLAADPPAAVATGDAFIVSAGCDKSSGVCRKRFANYENFRGFPLIPGEDWTTAYPKEGERHDGGSLFR